MATPPPAADDSRLLRHAVMLALDEAATDEDRDAMVAGLRALPDRVPGLLAIEVHRDAGLAEGNAAIHFTMTFADERSWRGYTPHPAHVRLAEDHILPVLRAKTAVQYWE